MNSVRFFAIVSVLLTLSPGLAWTQPSEQRRVSDMRREAGILIQQGEFQQAIELLKRSAPGKGDTNTLMQLLDLQVRLRDEAGAAATITQIEALLPADGSLVEFTEFQLAGALAGALYRMDRGAEADRVWLRMREQAATPQLALAVFLSYRQIRLFHEALEWAAERRRAAGDPALWALELSNMHKDAGQWKQAFDELLLWAESNNNSPGFLSRRMLSLAEDCTEQAGLMDYMYHQARRNGSRENGVSAAVLDVLIQTRHWDEATTLAWEVDQGSGDAPVSLAGSLLEANLPSRALEQLSRLEKEESPAFRRADVLLLHGTCLEMLERPETALKTYGRVRAMSSHLAAEATLRSAELLHMKLNRPAEAHQLFERLLTEQPDRFAAARSWLRLLASEQNHERGRRLLTEQEKLQSRKQDVMVEIQFLQLRLDLWQGRFTSLGEQLGEFLKRNLRHDTFNDAIELMDLFAFRTRDSLGVMTAADADRMEFAGNTIGAIGVLDSAVEQTEGPLREWFAWKACRLSEGVETPAERRLRYARFRAEWPASLHAERLDWMELDAMAEQELPADSLRAAGIAFLERWPEGMLQDAVRRRVRLLDEEGVRQ